jgi:hypothetical protein
MNTRFLLLTSLLVRGNALSLETRRSFIGAIGSACAGVAITANADVDVDDFMRSGMVSMPMGVSGQAGKAKPETGVLLRYAFM